MYHPMGSKVKVTANCDMKGRVGHIGYIDDGDDTLRVDFDNGMTGWYSPCDVESTSDSDSVKKEIKKDTRTLAERARAAGMRLW